MKVDANPEPPAVVAVHGEVATGLRSQITTEDLNRLDQVRFGFGVGTVGLEPEPALRHLGEMVVLGGTPLWTPVGMDGLTARREALGASIQSPFMVEWDGKVNLALRFDHRAGLPLESILPSVLEAASEEIPQPAEAAFVMILARARADRVRDQVVTEPMTPNNAPRNGGLIGDPPHRGRFFSSEVVSGMWPGEKPVTVLALALVLDASRRWLPDGDLERAFWPAEDPTSVRGLQIHCHASVIPGSGIPLSEPRGTVEELTEAFLSSSQDTEELAVVHVMPAAQFQEGVVVAGVPGRSNLV